MSLSFWQSTLDFALVYGLFAIAIYVNLAAGLLSFTAVPVGALTGFLAAELASAFAPPLIVLLFVGAVAGTGASVLIHLAFIRLESHYLGMATLALVLVAQVLVLNLSDITGGVRGRPVDYSVETTQTVIVVLVVAVVLARMRGSALWLSFNAIRADADVAASLGIRRVQAQRISFAVSGAVAGLGGVLLAGALQYIGPDTYGLPLLFVVLPAAVLGGTYHWVGPLVGALLLQAIPGLFEEITPLIVQVITGVLILLIVLFLPGGVVGDDWEKLYRRMIARAGRDDALEESEAAQ
jgi:branched-chain amino acid transport system permease protein